MSNQNIIIALLIVVVLGAGLWYALSMEGGNPISTNSDGEVVAKVNGEEITNDDFQAQLTQAKQMDLEMEEEQLKTEVLDQMIGNVLIKQKAEEKGITVEESEIDQQMNQVIQQSGGEEAFKKQLEEANITREELRERAREQILVQNYVDSEISEDKLEVTEEELKSYFDQMMAQQGNATNTPSFDEMQDSQKEQIRSQLKQQKRNQETQNLIKQLKEEANIEKLL